MGDARTRSARTEPIAREGWPFCGALLGVLAVAWLFDWSGFLQFLLFAAFVFSLYMFRNPERIPEEDDPAALIAPIDGKVKTIHKEGEALLVTINVFVSDAHFLRAPLSADISPAVRRHGVLLPLGNPNAGHLNEQSTVTFDQGDESIVMTLISSVFHGGNDFYKRTDPSLKAGERIGFFLNGDLTLQLPLSSRLKIAIGDTVTGGESVLGHLR